MLYYGMLCAAVIMFGVQFFFNQTYEKEIGNTATGAAVFALGSNVAGMAVLMIINGVKIDFTLFSVIMAFISGIDGMAFMYCSIKALGKVNLSRYSIFSMLGGMVLPFFTGIFFFDEKTDIGKIICFAIIALSVLLTLKDSKNRSGMKYCWGVFVTNGLSSVISTVFQRADFEKCDEAQFSILCAGACILMSLVAVLILKKPEKKITKRALTSMSAYGILNRLGNFLLLLALANLPASVQYPFVTGGVIIVSTVIGICTHQKPSKQEIASMLLAFAGVSALMFV